MAAEHHLVPPSQSQRRRPRISPEEVQRRIDLYDSLAEEFGWFKLFISTGNNLQQRQRYRRKHEIEPEQWIVLDCWPTTGVIGSYLNHPSQGKTQLFRRACHDDENDDENHNNNNNSNDDNHDSVVTSIFENPRAHTGKGYQRRTQLEHQHNNEYRAKRGRSDYDENNNNNNNDNDDDAMRRIMKAEDGGDEEKDGVKVEQHDEEEYGQQRAQKRRRLACPKGQGCRNYECAYSHPPRCFHGVFCWFQPNCWFDHTHGLCRYGNECDREDCWFSHRNPVFYY